MFPRRKFGPNPSHASECALPPRSKGGRAHSPAAKGVEESQFRRLEKKISTLPTLWSYLCTISLGIVSPYVFLKNRLRPGVFLSLPHILHYYRDLFKIVSRDGIFKLLRSPGIDSWNQFLDSLKFYKFGLLCQSKPSVGSRV